MFIPDDAYDNLHVCSRCGDYETTNPDGICWHCKEQDMIDTIVPGEDFDIHEKLKDVYTCKICGRPKTHHRLYGYLCENPEHNNRD